MTSQSGGGGLQPTQTVGGVLTGLLTAPSFATNGTTPILGVVAGALGADVNMPNANQFYDGPSVALTAGVWLVVAKLLIISGNASTQALTAKLWDGTTAIDADLAETVSTGFAVGLKGLGVYTAAGPVTLKFSVAGSVAVNAIKAAPTANSPGNLASTLVALRVA